MISTIHLPYVAYSNLMLPLFRFILNICFPYTASDEIARALTLSKDYYEDCHPDPSSFLASPADFSYFLDTWDSPPLDVLVRTSGEQRLSEFLLWQVCAGAVQIEIKECLWPEFGFKELMEIVLRYQRRMSGASRSQVKLKKGESEIAIWRLNQKQAILSNLTQ